MTTLDEARAVIAALPQPESEFEADTEPEHEAELEDFADLFGEPFEDSVPEQPVNVPVVAKQPERSRDREAPVSRDDRRREAARMVLESGLTVRRAANETGLSPSAVHRAVEAARRSGGIRERSGTAGQQESQQAPARPAWLPPNFKDEASFAASYKEAERKIREQGEMLREIRAENGELREQLGEAVRLLAELKRAGVIA